MKIVAVITLYCIYQVYGHGMVLEPINRGSLWRINSSYPVNFEDNENFCGGYEVQYGVNGGKCGICGDDYRDPRPRENENGGKYGLGQIVAVYPQGSIIDVSTILTANHLGYFEFHLCILKEPNALEEEECFTKLKFEDGNERYSITSDMYMVYNRVKLPDDITCDQCVLRWHYNTGNSWGTCEDGSGAIGCGDQETFRSCSDITITKI